MYQIKQLPEDFVVKEISNVKFLDKGNYLYFRLKKKNWNTLDAAKEISKRLRVPIKNIGFAGSKDKKAVTEQLISVKMRGNRHFDNLKIKDMKLGFMGYGNEPITLGDLEGNYFEIVIRNLDSFDIKTPKKIINYFGEQRFSKNNIEVGKCLIKKDFKKACEILELEVKNNDFIGALKIIPRRLLKMYAHAYQSFIWNETVTEAVGKGIKVEEVPLVGFCTELTEYGEKTREIIENILTKENLILTDFIIKQVPELSLEGNVRKVFIEVKDFKVLEKTKDELNKTKKKIKVSFSLPKGSYATVVIKEIVNN
jgi:tRNA pseudouridine13 synthase